MDNSYTGTEERNILLALATLIAAVTFQAGVNPPGGVWQEGVDQKAAVNPPGRVWQNDDYHKPGSAINATWNPIAYNVFLVCNTFAFSTSILVIFIMTHKFPKRAERFLATIAMVITYASAIFAVTPHGFVHFRYIFLAGFMPFVVRGFVEIVRACKKD